MAFPIFSHLPSIHKSHPTHPLMHHDACPSIHPLHPPRSHCSLHHLLSLPLLNKSTLFCLILPFLRSFTLGPHNTLAHRLHQMLFFHFHRPSLLPSSQHRPPPTVQISLETNELADRICVIAFLFGFFFFWPIKLFSITVMSISL